MKIALLLATKKGFCCLDKILKNEHGNKISFVSSFEEKNVEKSYDSSIEQLCVANGIEYIPWKQLKDRLELVCKKRNISMMFAVGWRYLIDTSVYSEMKHGLIIFHDSLLPRYRGFAPTPTAIIKGENVIGVSAISACEDVDRGDIVMQVRMEVNDDEYIQDIIERQCEVYSQMMVDIVHMAETNSIEYTEQNEEDASYCIWRNLEDCRIDWTKDADQIRNLVRAVGKPYPGAFSTYKKKKIIIERIEKCNDYAFEIRDCGKIWSVSDNKPSVICGKGMLTIERAVYEDGTPVVFNILRERLGD